VITTYKREKLTKTKVNYCHDLGEFFPEFIIVVTMPAESQACINQEMDRQLAVFIHKAMASILEVAPAAYMFNSEGKFRPFGPLADDISHFPRYNYKEQNLEVDEL